MSPDPSNRTILFDANAPQAFVIYAFFALLINYLGGERALLKTLEQRLRIHHLWPLNYIFSPMDVGIFHFPLHIVEMHLTKSLHRCQTPTPSSPSAAG